VKLRSDMITRYLVFVLGCSLSVQAIASVSPAVVYSPIPAVDCVVNPFRVVDISSPVVGIIEKLYVERSEAVSKGQVVAQLAASVERASVELARYRANVQSEIELSNVNINFDQLRKKRVDGLLAKHSISLESADQVEREMQLSQWELKQARELVGMRKLELRRAEAQLMQKSIRAPFDGFVLDTFKYSGEYVENQSILRLAQLDPLVIEAIVPMENFGMIKDGMLAEIRLEVLFKEGLLGKVIAVDRMGDTASNTFGVKLSMPNPENRIPAGLKCVVKFIEKADQPVAQTEDLQAVAVTSSGLLLGPAGFDEDNFKLSSGAAPDSTPAVAGLGDDIPLAANTRQQQRPEMQPQTDDVSQADEIANIVAMQKTPSSYMVLIEQGETDEATRKLIARLQAVGMKDFQHFNHGANKGLISLGIFSSRGSAIRRQQALDQHGFATFTLERFW
jgi:RND family efflux transporter MFP subunit